MATSVSKLPAPAPSRSPHRPIGASTQVLWAAILGVGLFALAAATPAALGLLADLSESFTAERGAVMGLYSVFLAVGQISGSLVGGIAAQLGGIGELAAMEHPMGTFSSVSS